MGSPFVRHQGYNMRVRGFWGLGKDLTFPSPFCRGGRFVLIRVGLDGPSLFFAGVFFQNIESVLVFQTPPQYPKFSQADFLWTKTMPLLLKKTIWMRYSMQKGRFPLCFCHRKPFAKSTTTPSISMTDCILSARRRTFSSGGNRALSAERALQCNRPPHVKPRDHAVFIPEAVRKITGISVLDLM